MKAGTTRSEGSRTRRDQDGRAKQAENQSGRVGVSEAWRGERRRDNKHWAQLLRREGKGEAR